MDNHRAATPTPAKGQVTKLLSMSKDKAGKDATIFSELGEALDGLVALATKQAEDAVETGKALSGLQQQLATLEKNFTELQTQLGKTADHSQQHRPPVTGGDATVLTQF